MNKKGHQFGVAHSTMWVALIYVVALNLRPAITAVGPLLPQLGTELGLNETAQGLLGSIPLIAFAVISPVVYRFSGRIGMERAIFAALAALVLGSVIRSYLGLGGLWLGTMLIGCAIGVGNVLVPTIVKRDFSTNISRATGAYSACITIGAAVASAVAVPLSNAIGWQGALAVWGLPVILVGLLWLPRIQPAITSTTTTQKPNSVWRQPMAWLVTAFMGLQSINFYFLVTWLPTIEIRYGISEQQAGWHLFLFQVLGFIGALLIPKLMTNPRHYTPACLVASIPALVGMLGLLLLPAWSLIWIIIAGLGSGAALVAALSLISVKGRSPEETTQLSGMAQSMGYLFAAIGPVLAGALTQVTGSWTAAMILIIILAALQVGACFFVDRVSWTELRPS